MITRKAIAITIGVLGAVVALLMMLGMSVMGSLMADARTDRITGPGVDVFLRTRFPGPGSEVVLEIEARGGSKAGLEFAVVRHGQAVLAQAEGDGVSWGATIRRGKTRGAEAVTVRFAVPEAIAAGDTLPLRIEVGYVVAMSSGSSFDNETHRDTVYLDVPVYSPSGKRWAQARLVGRALGLFALWGLLVWGIAALLARTDAGPRDRSDEEALGIGLLMGVLGSGFVGYWLFARPLMAGLELRSTIWTVLLCAAWLLIPPVWVWRRTRRRRPDPLPRARVV